MTLAADDFAFIANRANAIALALSLILAAHHPSKLPVCHGYPTVVIEHGEVQIKCEKRIPPT